MAVLGFSARRHAHPPFRHAVFLNVGFLHTIEADANFVLQNLRVEMRAFGVNAQVVWQRRFGFGVGLSHSKNAYLLELGEGAYY